MPRAAILDTGPLVCEPVLAETTYLRSGQRKTQDAVYDLLAGRALRIAFQVEEHGYELRALQRKYRDLPISLADACIVRMAEIFSRHSVFTLEADFAVFRKNGRDALELICPA